MKKLLFYSAVFFVTVVFNACKKENFFEVGSSISTNSDDFAKVKKPNVLVIFVDDVGYEVPSYSGGQSYSTPNLDRLASGGMQFTQCHSSPMCSPSRFTIMTGKYNFRNYTYWGKMDPNEKTIGNLMSDAGYATYYTGKWQLDGGDQSLTNFGWQQYSVWYPFNLDGREAAEGNRYKSSKIYEGGKYIPSEITQNVYSDDYFTSKLLRYIDSCKTIKKPFFAFYSMILCHKPFVPTPDDPEYNIWDFEKSDSRFFPSMVKYMDKKVGQIIAHLDSIKALQNTVVMFLADNGTASDITSVWNNMNVVGGKQSSNEPGTNIPFIVSMNKRIRAGSICDDLIDFTDFIPTLADIAGVKTPTTWGTLDGISFYRSLTGKNKKARATIYNSYATNNGGNIRPFQRWTQDVSYKLFDTSKSDKNFKFVKIEKGKKDSKPISNDDMTPDEQVKYNEFMQILRSYNP